jgi:hypothetical protein
MISFTLRALIGVKKENGFDVRPAFKHKSQGMGRGRWPK